MRNDRCLPNTPLVYVESGTTVPPLFRYPISVAVGVA